MSVTLTELANEIKKFINFKYATLEGTSGDYYEINFWQDKPSFIDWCKSWGNTNARMYGWLATDCFKVKLDLSEYHKKNGKIDFSKYIVEVTNVSE